MAQSLKVVVFIAIVFIFLNAIPTEDGESNWLAEAWGWLTDNWDSNVVGGIILLVVVVVIMYFITADRKINSSGST